MADLAEAIINPSYNTMKTSFPKEKHDYWEWKLLSPLHLEYAAKDGYVIYELYRKILTLKDRLRPTWQEMLCPRCKNALGELQ